MHETQKQPPPAGSTNTVVQRWKTKLGGVLNRKFLLGACLGVISFFIAIRTPKSKNDLNQAMSRMEFQEESSTIMSADTLYTTAYRTCCSTLEEDCTSSDREWFDRLRNKSCEIM
jgi:hypothetical protein